MDYQATIERVYQHVEVGDVDKAVMACLRIARNLHDYFHAAVFLRELYPDKKEFGRVFYDDTSHLKEEAQKLLWNTSSEYWLETHRLDFSIATGDFGDEKNLLIMGIGEIGPELDQWERSITDMTVPPGMGEFDTAAFTDRYVGQKAEIRLRMKALEAVRQRVRIRCLNYAISIEKQLQAQAKSRSFLEQIQRDVNNHFHSRCEDVYTKLQKAAQMVDSGDTEDHSLLLTQVRRAIKAAADHFYPAQAALVTCADGQQRNLDDDHYLNRLDQYLRTELNNSSSRKLLQTELDHLALFARRLNDVASKGVHGEVSSDEAKQGLLGLYMFLYNLIAHLERRES
jgi:hypothetical protein